MEQMQQHPYYPYTKNTLFQIFTKGDLYIQSKLKPKAIIIIGLPKSGKTSFFNIIRGKQLIGVNNNKVIHYNSIQNPNSLPYTFHSNSLLPTIQTLSIQGEEVSIVDTPIKLTFQDFQSFILPLHFHNKLFQVGQNFKFILTIGQQNLKSLDLEIFLKPFNAFLQLFKLSNAQIQSLCKSLFVVVSRATHKKWYLQNLLKLKFQMLKNNKIKRAKNKQLIISILSEIINTNKIFAFQNALENIQTKTEQMGLNQFIHHNKWTFINQNNIFQYQIKIQKFLEYDEIKQLNIKISQYQELFCNFSSIYKKFQAKLFINIYENCNFEDQFELLKQFVNKYDCYSQFLNDDSIIADKKIMKKVCNFQLDEQKIIQKQPLQKIMNLQTMYEKGFKLLTENYFYFENSFNSFMKAFTYIYANNEDNIEQCLKTAFIINRYFRNLMNIYIISSRIGPSFGFLLSCVQSLTDYQLYKFQKNFLLSNKKQIIKNLQKSKDIQKIRNYINYSKKIQLPYYQSQSIVKINLFILQLYILKGDLELQKKEFSQSIISFKKAFQKLNQLKRQEQYNQQYNEYQGNNSYLLQQNELYFQLQQNELYFQLQQNQEYSFNSKKLNQVFCLRIFQRIANSLELRNDIDALILSQDIYKHIQFIDKVCLIYEKIIFNLQTKNQKFQWLMKFSQFTELNGRPQDSIKIYQRALQNAQSNEAKNTIQTHIRDLRIYGLMEDYCYNFSVRTIEQQNSELMIKIDAYINDKLKNEIKELSEDKNEVQIQRQIQMIAI